ncbi:MAG: excinuclease ABC subunit UvrA [Planctomycetes bacterium]|nr:excinuclease ABC subunit UvrA [Planctomycetota bacterium]
MPDSPRQIRIRGAREHNLKGVDLAFPRDAMVTFTGVSGSGKSSLAHATIYQEGQRRFLESLSAYARQFLGRMEKPKVDAVEGLSPTVSIDQKSVGHSPRSTVGTLTEVADFLRLLWSRLGDPACPVCGAAIESWSVDRIVDAILAGHDGSALLVLAPVVRERKGEYRQELADWRARGFVRARIDGEVRRLDEDIELHRYKYHTIELVCDRLRVRREERSRLAEAVEHAVALGAGTVAIRDEDRDQDALFSTARACPDGHGALPELEPRLFSFNSPVGACQDCDGLGLVHSFDPALLVADEDASIAAGALHGFNADGRLLFGRLGLDHLAQVAAASGFDLETPWRRLGKAAQRVVLFGSGSKRFDFRWRRQGRNHEATGREHASWPGVIPHLERIYRGATRHALERFRRASTCPSCEGTRINATARSVRFEGRSLPEVLALPIAAARELFAGLALGGNRATIGREILREIDFRLGFLAEVGLGYLTLDRRANTLSGGESQRIRLAAQVGAGLRGILYVLDEPSIGLHARDQDRLIRTLHALRDRGNTVCIVEHDEATMRASDWLVDIGPGAGVHGGEIVAEGPPAAVFGGRSLTARFLRGEEVIGIPTVRRPRDPKQLLTVVGARHHNLQELTVAFPLGLFVVVTGVSGSGKSTLVNHILKRALRRQLMNANDVPGEHRRIDGIEHLDKIIEIDQSPIGRTPRSNAATYTGLWDHVRDLFASLPESRLREYKKGRFSFNVAGGRCTACEGAGVRTLEMQFLAPVEVECEECEGRRFNPETLEIEFKGRDVHDVLGLTIDEAFELFRDLPKIRRPLETLRDVGLGYLQLGQPSTTLSGGEAQRIKLATELQRPATGRTLYVLDEPTTGLHFEDVRRLLECLQALVDGGNSVIVIEHDLDVVKCADWLVDLGPEGGPGGGRLVAEGPPEEVAKVDASWTGRALRPLFDRRRSAQKARLAASTPGTAAPTHLQVRGARLHNLQNVDVAIPLDSFTVVTGPSGSGKTSLAFDTIFNEGQRRFVESLSTYARRFLGRMDRAPVDSLDGLGPAIAIDQRNSSRSPRSTVATATEIQDYLRLLYARIGRPHCPTHGQELVSHPPHLIAKELLADFAGRRGYLLAPIHVPDSVAADPDTRAHYLEELRAQWREQGFVRALVDGEEHRLEDPFPAPNADAEALQELHLVIDRTTFDDRGRLIDGAAQAAQIAHGRVVARTVDGEERLYSTDRSCPHCGHGTPREPHPRWFSFNHHSGACATCAGIGRVSACVPELLVSRPERGVFDGGIVASSGIYKLLTRKSGWFHTVAKAVAARYGFDLRTPWSELSPAHRRLLMRGAGEERFDVRFTSDRGGGRRTWRMATKWKGLGVQVEQWFQESKSSEALRPVIRESVCPDCEGERLGAAQRHVLVGGRSLPQLTGLAVDEALAAIEGLKLRKSERAIAADVLKEIRNRLGFLCDVGLGYLSLDRSAATLSGGEAQRIRLATQLGNQLVGVLYVLDEPTIGLHPRDTERLLDTLQGLRDLGNTVVAVEHDAAVIRRADFVVDMGPGAGNRGGRVVASGTPDEVATSDGLTGRYLRGELTIPRPTERRSPKGYIHLRNATTHNLKGVDVRFPLGVMCAVTGVSGSGKSSLVLDTLLPGLSTHRLQRLLPGRIVCDDLTFEELADRSYEELTACVVDQSPIGTTPSSNPATYTGILAPIRELFAQLPQSRMKGFGPGRFSFNVRGGRCDACEGKGQIQVEMHFLADVWITCEICHGRRFNAETLEVRLRDRSIADVLDMEVQDAVQFFGDHPKIRRPLQLLCDVGLGYLTLGQPANTMSGGEAQRMKLVASLARRPFGHTLHVLDEPTTGLHLDDVRKLVAVLQRLVDRGDSVLVVEHHLDVIACADHVIELGPEAGPRGGELIFAGPPEAMAVAKQSRTGGYLAAALRADGGPPRGRRRPAADRAPDFDPDAELEGTAP